MIQIMRQDAATFGAGSLERFGPYYRLVELAFFIIGALFWIGITSGVYVFTEDMWGRFAYSIPSLTWAALNMGAASICLIGLMNPVHKHKVLLGSLLHIAQHIALSFSAVFTGGDPAIGIYASILLLLLHGPMAIGALAEWKR